MHLFDMSINMLLSNIRVVFAHAMVFNACVLMIVCIWLQVEKAKVSVYQLHRNERLTFANRVRSSRESVYPIYLDQQRVSTQLPIIKAANSTLENSLPRKRIIFIGYRDHWPFHPPFDCDCQNHSISVERLNTNGDFSNTTDADSLIFVLASEGRISKMSWERLRKNRGPNQRWVFASRESASTTLDRMLPNEKFRYNTYHLSFTYHSKSDFYMPYGRYIPRATPEVDFNGTLSKILAGKKNLISWMSSSCGSSVKKWKRTSFAKSLSNVMPLHMYGTCGNMTCEKLTKSCTKKLLTYKFALILENSCCSEYITEKFWNALSYEQVPVVFGTKMEDYVRIAPPNSFIHMENFSNVHDLVHFLHRLDRDDNLYQRYHKWRENGDIKLAKLPRDFVSSCYSLCMIGSKLYALDEANDNSYHFDPYGPSWYGSCRDCDKVAKTLFHG